MRHSGAPCTGRWFASGEEEEGGGTLYRPLVRRNCRRNFSLTLTLPTEDERDRSTKLSFHSADCPAGGDLLLYGNRLGVRTKPGV